LLPGAAFVELALQSGAEAGTAQIEALHLDAPLALPRDGAIQLQLAVDAPDESGRRRLTVHARPESDDPDQPWTRHATGILAPAVPGPSAPTLDEWPPADAVPVEPTDHYGLLAERGYGYGPAFQGLRAVWQRGTETFAEVTLTPDPDLYGLHPALLDAALPAPDVVLAPLPPGPSASSDAVHAATAEVLTLLRSWLADDRFAASRLVLVTRGAVAAGPDEDVPDLAHAAVWGLVRSAQAE